ncbi:TrkA family potassium uptake protein [Sandaracinobacter sp. RS1-74]|uniref:potassium channel family protein n=1 Tax=Sandaracinobacteroides sayramensis TaxID=2913411 RepID=UPI001EDB2CB6|nr:TrkA family potassium uptake protein [Sandaracinobacteroides sayramensis]MCG2839610.1 TrkA family potassium uptake protein [Sandaracinobacteroides sayramensis]
MSADRKNGAPPVMVIGLGRFGTSVARSLTQLGHEVLGVDENMDMVQALSEELTHVVQADTTSTATLRKLGAGEMAHAVVGIGSDIESSVLTVVALLECGCRDIWAKAVNANHGRILERVGATHVVYPEAEMGERVAHLVTGKMMDFIAFDDDFAIVKTRAPTFMAGKTLAETNVQASHGVGVVGVKRPREAFLQAAPDMVIYMSDLLIISGPTDAVEKFAALC